MKKVILIALLFLGIQSHASAYVCKGRYMNSNLGVLWTDIEMPLTENSQTKKEYEGYYGGYRFTATFYDLGLGFGIRAGNGTDTYKGRAALPTIGHSSGASVNFGGESFEIGCEIIK